MFNMAYFLLLSGLMLLPLCDSSNHSDYVNSDRKAIRKEVLKDYDTVIGPMKITRDGNPIEIEFAFTPTNLVDVSTKDQILKIDGWVMQKWTDEYLSWNLTKYHNTAVCSFTPNEIWVPDIALKNNADRNEKLAGGRTKFITNAFVFHHGYVRWLSPATYTSVCKQNIEKWPMDTQVCYLEFGSFTYNNQHFVVTAPDAEYKPGSVSNGEWVIDSVQVNNTKSKTKCCGDFSIAKYKITITRKPGYTLMYLAPPSLLLVLLAMISFCIPIESGERIGFTTTILLAFMVLQLMLPDHLPKTSDQVPFFGILLVKSMFVISWVLIISILILACYHSEGTPPISVKKLFFPWRFKKKRNNDVETGDSDIVRDGVNEAWVDKRDAMTWKYVAFKFNKLAFWGTWVFVAILLIGLFFI